MSTKYRLTPEGLRLAKKKKTKILSIISEDANALRTMVHAPKKSWTPKELAGEVYLGYSPLIRDPEAFAERMFARLAFKGLIAPELPPVPHRRFRFGEGSRLLRKPPRITPKTPRLRR